MTGRGGELLKTMTPTQIAHLEAEFLRRAREFRNEDKAIANLFAAAAWEAAAALLIEASNAKGRRRTFRPLDLSNRIGG